MSAGRAARHTGPWRGLERLFSFLGSKTGALAGALTMRVKRRRARRRLAARRVIPEEAWGAKSRIDARTVRRRGGGSLIARHGSAQVCRVSMARRLRAAVANRRVALLVEKPTPLLPKMAPAKLDTEQIKEKALRDLLGLLESVCRPPVAGRV